MSKTMSVAGAVRQAEKKYLGIERFQDRQFTLSEIRRLADAGVSNPVIAQLVGMSVRNVDRIRAGKVEQPTPPAVDYRFDRRQDRAEKLERMVQDSFDLACRLRDEDPQLVYHSLTLLDVQRLRELVMIGLAAMPIDRPISEVFAWVTA